MRTAADYTVLLQQLLPPGRAWTRAPGAVLTRLLAAWAAEFARLDARADDLLAEVDPRQSYELLADWERVLGLPDGCSPVLGTVAERRAAVVQKLAVQGGQTRAFYVAMAAALGFEVVIHDLDPDVGDFAPGLDVSGGKWRLVWRVEVLTQVDYAVFRVGSGRVGDRLVEGGALDLECVIRRAAPAHTQVIFTYPED